MSRVIVRTSPAHLLRVVPAIHECDDEPTRIDYEPIRGAAITAVTWLLDVARSRALVAEDLEAIDRVERAALATLNGIPMRGRPANLRASHEDALAVAAILIDTFSIDFRVPGLSEIFGALYSNIDWISRSTVVDPPPPPTVGHAMQRHGGELARVARGLVAQLVRGPRVAHGADEDPTLVRARRRAG